MKSCSGLKVESVKVQKHKRYAGHPDFKATNIAALQ
jgi:hypothetical protein